jgi:hypothetical protein
LACAGYAPLASPTFTGTSTFPDAVVIDSNGLNSGNRLTIPGTGIMVASGILYMPDGSTWNTSGINSLKSLGVGIAASTTFGALATLEANGNQGTSVSVINTTAGANAESTYYLNNDLGHYAAMSLESSTFTAGGPQTSTDSMNFSTSAANGIQLDVPTGSSFRVYGGSVPFATLNPAGINLQSGNYEVNGAQIATTNLSDTVPITAFTPVVKFGGANVGASYNNQSGFYYKIGKQVTLFFQVGVVSPGTSTGNAQVCTLPVTGNTTYGQGPFAPVALVGPFTTLPGPVVSAMSAATSTCIDLDSQPSGGNIVALTQANFQSGANIVYGSVTYLTN